MGLRGGDILLGGSGRHGGCPSDPETELGGTGSVPSVVELVGRTLRPTERTRYGAHPPTPPRNHPTKKRVPVRTPARDFDVIPEA